MLEEILAGYGPINFVHNLALKTGLLYGCELEGGGALSNQIQLTHLWEVSLTEVITF